MPQAPKPARKRLMREYRDIYKTPPPHIVAAPLPSNILECHYCIHGLDEGPYKGGYYHGKIVFPEQYPFKPPSIMMVTPNGRFKTSTRLCLSMSDYHPDQWNPTWSTELILKGLLSFMLEDTGTAGSIITTEAQKQAFAAESGAVNLKNPIFTELFPTLVEKIVEDASKKQAAAAAAGGGSGANGVNGKADGAGGNDATGGTAEVAAGLDSWGGNAVLVFAIAVFAYVVMHILEEVDSV